MSARILVVDDQTDVVMFIRQILAEAGYEVLAASNGQEGLDAARRESPDLMLLDLKMEGLDGLTVCEILRREPATAKLPVIVVTGYGGELARIQALSVGASDFITKPFQAKDLLRRVEVALAAEAT